MRTKILILMIVGLLMSCSKDDNGQRIENMRVNHYRNTGHVVGSKLVFLVQEGNNIGTKKWDTFYDPIEGFNYEPGYIYNLSVLIEPIKNPPADGSSFKYTLKKIISKSKVDNDTPFEINLKIGGRSFVKNKKILNEIEIDCNSLCDELETKLENQEFVVGKFNRLDKNKIKLIGFE